MTRDEFELIRASLTCQECGVVGLTTESNPNNGGMRPHCPHCGSPKPVNNVMWLSKAAVRTPRRAPVDVDKIWKDCGDHCTHCGASRALLESLRIGRTVQHMVPFWKAGDQFPVVPYCARCHQESTARQETTRRYEDRDATRDATLNTIIKRIEEKAPHLKSDIVPE